MDSKLEGVFPRAKLTPEQNRLWTDARAATLWTQSAFADVWYSLMVDDKGEQAWFTEAAECSVAATNGRYIFLNPKTYLSDKYSLGNRVFINCHEILHAIFDHMGVMRAAQKSGKITYADGVSLDYQDNIAQVAADYLINDALIKANVGAKPDDCLHKPDLVTENDSLPDAYRKVYMDCKKNGGKGAMKPNTGRQKGFDAHLAPGQGDGRDEQTAKGERSEAEWQQAVAAALESARQQGRLPAGLERLLGKVMEPEIDWQDKLRTALTRRVGGSGASWDHLDDALVIRGVGAPGRIAYGAGHIVVAMDTSGSMTQAHMDKCVSETIGILDDLRPKQLTFIQCDADVQEVIECDDADDMRRMKIKGLGGTDFRPVFNWVDANSDTPDALIYFTDTYGAFPASAPDYPVIWVSLEKGASVPWGDYLEAPIKFND